MIDNQAPMTPQTCSERWRPRTAWLCLVAIILAGLLGLVLLAVVVPDRDALRRVLNSTAGYFFFGSGGSVLSLAIAVCFARVRTRQEFIDCFRLHLPSPRQLLIAAVIGFLIPVCIVLAFENALSQLQLRTSFTLWSLALLVAPFLEEPLMRGFIYAAFRSGYSVTVSTALVVGIALVLHGSRITRSSEALVGIGVLNVVTCMFRERTNNLWPCITCHLTYNIVPVIFRW